MANGIRTGDPRGFNKGQNSKFCVGSRVRQTPEEGQRTYQLKHCGNNNKDDDNRGARDVMVIIVGNGHGDVSSNPGRDWLHFT